MGTGHQQHTADLEMHNPQYALLFLRKHSPEIPRVTIIQSLTFPPKLCQNLAIKFYIQKTSSALTSEAK